MTVVYLLCLDRNYKHARHYLGCTDDLERRIEMHRAGRGARLMEVVTAAGIGFTIARIWEGGDFKLEKKLKHQKHHSRLCPLCHPGSAMRRAIETQETLCQS